MSVFRCVGRAVSGLSGEIPSSLSRYTCTYCRDVPSAGEASHNYDELFLKGPAKSVDPTQATLSFIESLVFGTN